ncbi:hypothetical protein FQN57_000441 [Myotisia sp. PD_48]|nr:hypothetical protein FQN57_000441 [Myotisia sp. PD_48]
MATLTNKLGADMPTFSYAQAAKGLAISHSDVSRDDKNTAATVSAEQNNTTDSCNSTNEGGSAQSQPSHESTSVRDASEIKTGPSSIDGDVAFSQNGLVTGATSTSGKSFTDSLSKDEEASMASNQSDAGRETASQSSTVAEKSIQVGGESKTEDGNSENSNSLSKEAKSTAPPVNVWQQRREAQEAKARANALLKQTSKLSSTSTSPQAASDSRIEQPKGSSRRKPSDTATDSREKRKASEGLRKVPNRSNRPVGLFSADTQPLPPVADTTLWPTPQIAQGEGSRKTQEKPERLEKPEKEKPAGSRTHVKEKWMPVPYVPTAVFNTPLPPAARRGGRNSRGAREPGPRGGSHMAIAASGHEREKHTRSSSASPLGSKPIPSHPRDESEKPKMAPDATLQCHDSGEPSMHPQAQPPSEAQKETKQSTDASTADGNHHSHPNSSHSPSNTRRDSKAFSKPYDATTPKSMDQNQSRHVSSLIDTHGRYSANGDRRFGMNSRSTEFYKESGFSPRERDFPKDREREFGRERGESRSERGRGGYRGRGGHSTYSTPQNAPYHSAPIGQHPFPSKSYNFNNERHRMHQPTANGSQHHGSSSRGNLRSPSMPNPGMYASAPYPIQTEVSTMYPYQHLPQSPMTAVSYQPYMENFSLMSMISMQLEYYFSVDNLCKDLFLRKHMDSQGFVLLGFIASFKRIKSLTEDMELLRFVCRQLRNVEYRPGENGVDRLRKREKWDQWVLSMELRDPTAQNDGPTSDGLDQSQKFLQDETTPYLNGNSGINGVASLEDAPKRSIKLSSAAPEFSPMGATAGHEIGGTNAENAFPNNQIENLVIVTGVRSQDLIGSADQNGGQYYGMPLGQPGPSPTYFSNRQSLPANTIIRFVPQQTAWIVERMGKFSRILAPGLAVLVPFLDRIAYVKSLKESAIEIPSQTAITADNVTLELDGVLYTRVFDAYKASYGVEDAEYAISQLAQTTMRSEIGQLSLDNVLKERATLNTHITQAINEAAQDWGVVCLRYEIRDIHAPEGVVAAMHRMVTAERSKRAEILESEGQRQSAINIAEGRKQSVILASEAMESEQVNLAAGEAEAIRMRAEATSCAIDAVARSIREGQESARAAISLTVAEKYVDAFSKLARESTAVVVPGNVGDIGGMIASAMAVYGKVSETQAKALASKALQSQEASLEKKFGDPQRSAPDLPRNFVESDQTLPETAGGSHGEVGNRVLEGFEQASNRRS